MGLYIEVPAFRNKAATIKELAPDAQDMPEGASYDDCPEDCLPVCVVDNGPFEAAGVAYNRREFGRFLLPSDSHPRTWLWVPIHFIKANAPAAKGYLQEEQP